MYAKTHEILTREAAKLADVGEELIPSLCLGARSPDLVPDYDYKVYLTYRGKLKVRKTRIKHHKPNPNLLKKHIIEARHRWLNGEEEAAKLTGRVLHYIGDSTIISPTIDEGLHDQMERECSRISPRQVVENLNLLKPIGKKETLKVLMESLEQGPASNALEAVKRTLATSFSIISSILSPREAPKKFILLGNRCYECFMLKKRFITILSLLLMAFPLTDLVTLSPLIGLVAALLMIFTIIPSTLAGISGLIMSKFRDLNSTLYSAKRLYRLMPWIMLGAILSGLMVLGIGFTFIAIYIILRSIVMSAIIYYRLFRFQEWREIKDEIDWFRWE